MNLSVKASTLSLTVQCLIDSLRDNFDKLVQKTLTMEDPRLTILQSQPMYDSDNTVDYTEEILEESSQKQPQKSQNFSQQKPAESKIVNRHKIRYTATRIKYSPTRIKSRNFLSNVSYTGISKNDFYNENFILDVYVLLVKNLNPFSLSRKVTDKTKHEMVYMLWRECVPSEFYRYICEEKNLIYVNGQDVGQPGVLEIVGGFIDQGKQNLRMLQEHLARFKDIFQYVYSHIFPEVCTTSEKQGFDLKSNFHIIFNTYRDKMMIRQQSLAKNRVNYETEQQQNETCQFEKKPIKNFDEFSDSEEQEVKQPAEKQLAERHKKAEDLKAKKRKQKSEESKVKEGEMWSRLNELNGEFKKFRQSKIEAKKMSSAVL